MRAERLLVGKRAVGHVIPQPRVTGLSRGPQVRAVAGGVERLQIHARPAQRLAARSRASRARGVRRVTHRIENDRSRPCRAAIRLARTAQLPGAGPQLGLQNFELSFLAFPVALTR